MSLYRLAAEFAVSNGILKQVDGNPFILSCTLLPSPMPKSLLYRAQEVQCDFNLLYHKAAMDHEFLEAVLKPVLCVDSYLRSLWDIYLRVRCSAVMQDLVLGLNRSDYMLHLEEDLCDEKREFLANRLGSTRVAARYEVESDEHVWDGLSLRQVEFNMIACSFCGLIQCLIPQHRIALSLHGLFKDINVRVPDCFSADRFSEALLFACRIFNLRLFVDNEEIAVVYYRTGYTPGAFPDDETWNVKYQLEQSLAIKCPCIQYLLVNTKIVQAALSKKKYLSRFFQPGSLSYRNIMSTFTNQYTLDEEMGISNSTEIQQVISDCMLKPENYVLKPQREGGGNNYFGVDIVQKLKSIINHDERKVYVLMERIRPYVFENHILNSSSSHKEPKVEKWSLNWAFSVPSLHVKMKSI
ncbi:unnamed protein product [Heterobilharzia americana]|nr:unnamed protein product [Heterobilharzia americana]